jgi:predicted nucleic acid-binding protein
MLYLLDTNVVMYLLRQRVPVAGRYEAALGQASEFLLSPIVHFEVSRYLVLKGATRLQHTYQQLAADWALSDLIGQDWDMAAELWARRHQMGRPIEDADLLIAVTALKAGAVLVTNNGRHYDGLGLTLEDWVDPVDHQP